MKFFNAEKDIIVTLTPTADGYDFVILGDESKVSNRELLTLSLGDAPKGWTKLDN